MSAPRPVLASDRPLPPASLRALPRRFAAILTGLLVPVVASAQAQTAPFGPTGTAPVAAEAAPTASPAPASAPTGGAVAGALGGAAGAGPTGTVDGAPTAAASAPTTAPTVSAAPAIAPGVAQNNAWGLWPTLAGFRVTLSGYIHGSYRWISEPQNYTLVGRNNGFQLPQARVVADAQWKNRLSARVSVEAASEDRLSQSFPGGQMTTRLRDAYITWAPLRELRVTVGQQATPWDLESLRSDAELPFVSRSVAVEGVQPTEGLATRGLGADRNLGISLHSGFIGLSRGTSFRYSLFAGNGNGQNQLLNDNNIPALYGRVEFAYWGQAGLPQDQVRPMFSVVDDFRKPILHIGLASQWNPRTVGNLPDLMRETDAGVAVDAALTLLGFELQGGFLYLRTSRDTLTGVPDLERLGFWGHLRYTIPRIPLQITPGYRISSYAPRAHVGTQPATEMDRQFDASYTLLYHTLGVFLRPTRTFPLHGSLGYTFATESEPNILNNDRFEADIVLIF